MDEQTVVHPYSGVLLSNSKWWTTDIHDNMAGSLKQQPDQLVLPALGSLSPAPCPTPNCALRKDHQPAESLVPTLLSHWFKICDGNFFFFLWLCWVFVAVRGLSLVAASGGHSSSRCAGLSLSRPLLLRSTSSRCAGSVVVAHGPSCSAVCGIFPDQGSNPCPLHWQADCQPLCHQGSPVMVIFMSKSKGLHKTACTEGQVSEWSREARSGGVYSFPEAATA